MHLLNGKKTQIDDNVCMSIGVSNDEKYNQPGIKRRTIYEPNLILYRLEFMKRLMPKSAKIGKKKYLNCDRLLVHLRML